jgi:hypothetical protein
MMKRLLLPLLVLILFLSSSNVVAQSPPPKENAEAAEAARIELEKKAVGLVEDALAEAEGLKLVENRVRAQTVAVRLLWPRDEKSARTLFKAAADEVVALNNSVDAEDPQFYNAAQTVTQLRTELLQAVTPYDPKLALEFLRATRQTYAAAYHGFGQPDQEQMLEMNLASQIAMQDPRQAVSLAEESLSKGGVTTGLVRVLEQIRMKDPAAASKLAGDIIKRIRPEDLSNNYEVSGAAVQLLSMTRPADPVSTGPQQTVTVIEGPMPTVGPVSGPVSNNLIDRQTRAELIEKIIAAATSDTTNQNSVYNLFNALQGIMPELERYAPARVIALRRKAEAMERSINPMGAIIRPYQELMQSGSVEAMLEAAPKAPPEVRDQLYMQAAWKSLGDGSDVERARQIVEHIANPQQRAQMRRGLEQQAQWRTAQKGNFAEARQLISRLPTVEEKVNALVQIASTAVNAGDRQTARQVLAEARSLFGGRAQSYPQFSTMLQLASVYAQVDAEESFEMVESAIDHLNELIDAAALVNGFGQDSFREDELRPQGGYMWNELINLCASTLAVLAPTDFERAHADAKRFRRADARVMAQLMLAQHLINMMSTMRGQMYGGRQPTIRRRGGGD